MIPLIQRIKLILVVALIFMSRVSGKHYGLSPVCHWRIVEDTISNQGYKQITNLCVYELWKSPSRKI